MKEYITAQGLEIRTAIRDAEAIADDLMMSLAKVRQAILSARSHPEVLPHVGQKALLKLARAEQEALMTSNQIIRTHDELSRIAVTMDFEHSTLISGLSAEPEIAQGLEVELA